MTISRACVLYLIVMSCQTPLWLMSDDCVSICSERLITVDVKFFNPVLWKLWHKPFNSLRDMQQKMPEMLQTDIIHQLVNPLILGPPQRVWNLSPVSGCQQCEYQKVARPLQSPHCLYSSLQGLYVAWQCRHTYILGVDFNRRVKLGGPFAPLMQTDLYILKSSITVAISSWCLSAWVSILMKFQKLTVSWFSRNVTARDGHHPIKPGGLPCPSFSRQYSFFCKPVKLCMYDYSLIFTSARKVARKEEACQGTPRPGLQSDIDNRPHGNLVARFCPLLPEIVLLISGRLPFEESFLDNVDAYETKSNLCLKLMMSEMIQEHLLQHFDECRCN